MLLMIGRLIEDAIFLGRIAYFYKKSVESTRPVGYHPTSGSTVSRKDRAKWAWNRALSGK